MEFAVCPLAPKQFVQSLHKGLGKIVREVDEVAEGDAMFVKGAVESII